VLARFLATWPETREVSQRVQHAVIASHRSRSSASAALRDRINLFARRAVKAVDGFDDGLCSSFAPRREHDLVPVGVLYAALGRRTATVSSRSLALGSQAGGAFRLTVGVTAAGVVAPAFSR